MPRRLLIAILILGAVALAGCSGENRRSEENVLRIWQGFGGEEADAFGVIMADFEARYKAETGKDITVKVDYVSYGDMFTKLKTAALANITPDIAILDSSAVTDLAFGQALVPIDTLEGFKKRYGSIEEAREEFVHATFDEGTVSRVGEVHLYGLPAQTTTVALFWNRAMFRQKASELREAGLDPNRAPRDWDELIEYGKILNGENRYGYAIYGSFWFTLPFYNMYGTEFVEFDENGRATAAFDSPNTVAALEMIERIMESGVEGGGWKIGGLGPDTGFLNQQYAMALTGPWNVEKFRNSGLDFDIALVPAPPQRDIDRLGLEPVDPSLVDELGIQAWSSSNLGGQQGVILRSSENRDLAYEALEYFTSDEIQRRWAEAVGNIPVRLSAWEDLDLSKYPYNKTFMTQLRLTKRRPQIPLLGTVEGDVINPAFNLFLSGEETTAEVMAENVQERIQSRVFDRLNEALESERKRLGLDES